jgi:preprotein translocase subunit SecE
MAVAERIKDARTFVEECWTELQKVTWPDWDQLKNATLVVLAFTVAIAMIIWMMDVVIRTIVGYIMGMFGA